MTVVSLFEDFAIANSAATELESAGIARDQISLVAGNAAAKFGSGSGIAAGLLSTALPDVGPVVCTGPIANATGGLRTGLKNVGVAETDAEYYVEGIRRGAVLLTVRTSDQFVNRAAEILKFAGAIDSEKKTSVPRPIDWPSRPMYEHLAGKVQIYSDVLQPAPPKEVRNEPKAVRNEYEMNPYFAPAYRFGREYGLDSRYRSRDWSAVERDVRRDWNDRGSGRWDEFKEAIRQGWEGVRARR